MTTTTAWAEATFGDADLGDHRRTRRLVAMAAAFADRPSGRVTEVLHDSAAREAGFRLVESAFVDPAAIAAAAHRATARRCQSERTVIVPIDQTTLTLTDRTGSKGFGRTGTTDVGQKIVRRGFHVMTALVVGGTGVNHGIVGQAWINRQAKAPHALRWRDKRPVEERESGLWTRVIAESLAMLRAQSPATIPWFQLDRGGDAAHVVQFAVENQLLLTVRSAHDRAVVGGGFLKQRLRSAPVSGRYDVLVSARNGRPPRRARMSVRFRAITLRMSHQCTGRRIDAPVTVVEAREVSNPRDKKPRLNWRLITTKNVTCFQDAFDVIRAYTLRWRVEDLHRAWKTGTCNIERSQLRSAGAFQRWATIAATVAARAEQLKTMSRADPQVSALTALSRAEVDAAIVLSRTKDHRIGDEITLERAVFLIACVGGYVGKHARTKPGVLTISRGLQRVIVGAEMVTALNR